MLDDRQAQTIRWLANSSRALILLRPTELDGGTPSLPLRVLYRDANCFLSGAGFESNT